MTHLIEHLAELTGFRDRDLLDVSIVRAIKDVLQPLSVGIFRRVGEEDQEHWITRARLVAGSSTPTADPLWTELNALPRLVDEPHRRACLLEATVVNLERGGHAVTMYPIATEREVIGVLEIETQSPLPPGDSAMVATIVRIYGNFLDLLDHSERDPLTGLLNRQTFNAAPTQRATPHAGGAAVSSVPNRRARSEAPVSWLGVIDIDHFKRVNDTWGHATGDRALCAVAERLAASVRAEDFVARIGGEEFLIVCGGADALKGSELAERLRSAVESLRIAAPDGSSIQLTASLGVSTPFTTLDAWPFAAMEADKALYAAKASGRNRVISTAPMGLQPIAGH